MSMIPEAVFEQNSGDVTKAYYALLNSLGPRGELAVALFRAQKRSTAAKSYRRGRFRQSAYDVKSWSLSEVCRILQTHGEALGMVAGESWGWKEDPAVLFDGEPSQVLYVDLRGIGQCSFHSPTRGSGPDYFGSWVGPRGSSKEVILQFCREVSGS